MFYLIILSMPPILEHGLFLFFFFYFSPLLTGSLFSSCGTSATNDGAEASLGLYEQTAATERSEHLISRAANMFRDPLTSFSSG